MNIPDLHRRSVEWFDGRMANVKASQWDLPTPCADWTVRQLVNHIVNEDRWTPELFAGKTLEEVGDRFDGDLLGDDPHGAWQDASKEACNAVQAEGAMERTINVSWGQISGAEYAGQLFLDHLIHGWDLARATGQPDIMDPELVEACYQNAKEQEEMIRGSGVFGDEVQLPEDAGLQTKLLALLGRRQ